ncbi:hypothetical protein AB205_0000540 [Aquarana catesbeiana]|uniref:Uncharacterized protein n=1 Tax=Aquarana catesbeiana TaxID=8400 RepID=A0A2G9RZM7_AQUCT|nr:hypothetical protein AB205_0000540 [Aquarana catesbeiana]
MMHVGEDAPLSVFQIPEAAFIPERFKVARFCPFFYCVFVQVTNVKGRKMPIICPKETHVFF